MDNGAKVTVGMLNRYKKETVLWENPDVTQTFPKTTLDLGETVSNYEEILIACNITRVNSAKFFAKIIVSKDKVSDWSTASVIYTTNNGEIIARRISINTDPPTSNRRGMIIYDCVKSDGTVTNEYLIPYKVIGIKYTVEGGGITLNNPLTFLQRPATLRQVF